MRNKLHEVIMDLVGAINRPQGDDFLLRRAGVSLDRALFPLLIRIGLYGPIGVVKLSALIGRDHSTISRQLSKLERLRLIRRVSALEDQRLRECVLTDAGRKMAEVIGSARRKIYAELLKEWSPKDRNELERLMRKFTDIYIEASAKSD